MKQIIGKTLTLKQQQCILMVISEQNSNYMIMPRYLELEILDNMYSRNLYPMDFRFYAWITRVISITSKSAT
jgi:hypothetical protein